MNRIVILTTAALAAAATAFGGNITGRVHAEGKPEAAQDAAGGGRYDSHDLKFAARVNYEDMRDFVIYIDGPAGYKPDTANQMVQQVVTKKVSQKKAQFSPHVLPVVVGTTVEWPNDDDIYHNVFSYSEAQPFDLGLYKAPEVGKVKFEKAGKVDVFCSIHADMSCVVLVLENPYFAVSNSKGEFVITNVPAGTYKLKAWHDRMPPQTRDIAVPETGEVKLDITLGINNLPKY
jgi:plastocyanin